MALVTSAAASLKNTWGFSPQSIPGLALWLDGADTTSITGTSAVSAWRNKGAAGGSASTTSGTVNSTSATINGLPTVSFATDAYMTAPSMTFTQTTRTIFIVVKIGASGVRRNFLLGTPASTSTINVFAFSYYNASPTYTDLELSLYGVNLYQVQTPSPTIFNTSSIICMTTLATNAGIFVNGTKQTLNVTNTTAYGTGTTTTQTIGGIGGAASNPFDLGEVMIFDGAITDIQRQQVEGYLAAKWGLGMNLPTTHPYSTGSIIPFNRPFYPTDIPGCSLWLDGADRSSMTFSSGTSVSSWNDKSGNGYNFTNNGGSTNPTADPTMGLLFTTTRSFANSSVPIPSNYTLFLVGNLTSIPSSYGRMINMNTTTDGFGFLGTFNNSFNFATFTGSGGGTWYDTNANTPTNTVASSPNLSIMAMTISGTSLTPFFNGTILNSKTNSGSTSSTTGMCLNGISFAGQGVNAHFAEVFLFNSPLSTSQRQQVEQYLAWKWGLVANLPPATSHLGKLLPAFSTNFTPKSVAGMRWWVDGMDTSTMTFSSGSNITQWRDKSGNAYHATGVNSPQKLPSGGVSFNAASSRYFTMAVPYSTTNTVFMVAPPKNPHEFALIVALSTIEKACAPL